MKQAVVKFQSENVNQTYSSVGGVILAEEIFKRFGINHAIDKHIGARTAGSGVKYTDSTYVLWHRERCDKSEEIDHILKNELAGGHIVTSALGANAAWWQIAILSANMLSLIKRLCLPGSYRNSRPKKLRFHLFSAVARISKHARKTAVVICNSFSARLLKTAWNRLVQIQCLLE